MVQFLVPFYGTRLCEVLQLDALLLNRKLHWEPHQKDSRQVTSNDANTF